MDAAQASSGRATPQILSLSALSDFPFEWAGVAAVALVDAVWAHRVGFSLAVAARDAGALIILLVVGLCFRVAVRDLRGSLISEYIALTVVAAGAFAVLSYLACAMALPLIDARLLRFDRAMGFHWMFWFKVLLQHPVVVAALQLFYASMYWQAMFFVTLFGLARDRSRLREVFWITFAASALTTLISIVLPALGPFDRFQMGDLGGYLADMKHLRRGSDLHFAFARLTGVISFPSFHTSVALIYMYAFRGMGPITLLMVALNLLMLPSIPFIGGHYLCDMLAGAAVAVFSIVLVRKLVVPRLLAPSGAMLPLQHA
jgi:hypothetical protein